MSNNKKSSVEWLYNKMYEHRGNITIEEFEQAKAMQQEQAHFYASFVLKCVQNNLPPITFNDWINLENNEEHKTK